MHWGVLRCSVLAFLNSYARQSAYGDRNEFVDEAGVDEAGVLKLMATAMIDNGLKECLQYHEALAKTYLAKEKTDWELMMQNFSFVCSGLRDGRSWKEKAVSADTLAVVLSTTERCSRARARSRAFLKNSARQHQLQRVS